MAEQNKPGEEDIRAEILEALDEIRVGIMTGKHRYAGAVVVTLIREDGNEIEANATFISPSCIGCGTLLAARTIGAASDLLGKLGDIPTAVQTRRLMDTVLKSSHLGAHSVDLGEE